MTSRRLETVEEVVEALGGNARVLEITGRTSSGTVPNWKKRRAFPPDTILTLRAELEKLSMHAPASLWGIPEAVDG